MTKLKLGPLSDDKPVRLTVELPTELHRRLVCYADYLNGHHVFVSFSGELAWRN